MSQHQQLLPICPHFPSVMAFHTWLLVFVPLVCAFFIDLVNAVMIPVFLTNFDEGSVFSIEIFSFNENSVTLKLTKWELANLHLPPVTTVTLYQGDAPIDFLCQRLASILTKNPWISSRIIKKITADKVEALAYPKVFEAMDVIDRHLTVYKSGDIGFSLDMSYQELVSCLLPVQCARSKPAIDTDEALFKVAVVSIEAGAIDDKSSILLQQSLKLPGFALVVSMNHTLGDGHTYYKLYNMLSADTDVEALDPVRVTGFEEAKTKVIGEKENAMFTSAALGFGIIGSYMGAKVTRRKPQNICIHTIDPAWVIQEKAKAKEEKQVPFVSANDAITSWFFREMKSDLNIMVANFRNREPSVLGLNNHHAGNYEANVPYFPGDVVTPSLIRRSIRDTEGKFRANRACSPTTKIPFFLTLLLNRTALITNWATFYSDLVLQTDLPENKICKYIPKLHLPIMESDGIITSVWNNGIIFRPRAGELAILMITRRFDSDELIQLKAQGGSNVPMGARIV